jgi:hypothetical protein
MKKNKINPLEELRQEKVIVRKEVADSEDRLAEHWVYLSDNAPSLLMNSAVNGIAGWFGFGHKQESEQDKSDSGSNGIMHNILGAVTAYYPLIWEIVQPVLLRFAMNKIKSIFTRKKKKKYNND